jgi:hypothetical protein
MIFTRNPGLTLDVLRARVFAWKQQQQQADGLQRYADEIMKKIRSDAKAAGLASELDALLAPAPPTPPAEPHVRVRAEKAYRVLHRGRHEPEWYSGGPGAVVDIPAALLPALKGRVVVVPPTTEIVGVPLRPGDQTDD